MKKYNINELREVNGLYSKAMKELGYKVYEADESTDVVIREDREMYIHDVRRIMRIYECCLYELCYVENGDDAYLGVEIYKKINYRR